jgi:CHAT domain-containing protein
MLACGAILACCFGCHKAANPRLIHDRISLQIQQGDLSNALKEADLALAEFGTKSEEWEWRFRLLKAQILISQSNPQEALSLLKGKLSTPWTYTDIAVRKAMFEGIADRYAQQFEESEKQLAVAQHLASSFQPQLLCDVLNARGALEAAENKYSSAELSFRKALDIVRKQNRPTLEANILGNLAWLAISEGHFDEAVDLNQAALLRVRSLGMKSLEATILGNMGWSNFQLGDFERALEFYKDGAEQSERSGLNGYSAYWFTGVSNSYLALHDYVSAENLTKRTLERARNLNNAQTIAICLNTLAEVALETGRLDTAQRYNQEAINLEEAGADHFSVLESVLLSGRIATKRGHFAQAESSFRRVIEDRSAEAAVKWKAEARLAEVHDAEDMPTAAEREYRQSLNTIQTVRSSIERDDLRLSFLSGGIEFYADYIDFLIRRKRPADALRVADLSRARTLEEGLNTAGDSAVPTSGALQPRQLAKQLEATLLFYWIGHNQSYLWAITPGKMKQFTLPKSAEIEPLVQSYQKAILGMRDAEDPGGSAGKQLYATLVAPAKTLIPRGGRVIVLPAESLYGLNFETLVVPDPKPHFWIEDVTLTTASSLTLLEHSIARAAAKGKSLLLVGNTEQPNAEFPRLPQAPAEMQRIERYFPDSQRKVLQGKQATPSAYLGSSPERFSYLHFVTHGTASHTRPLESAVILSAEGDSYKLYARDIVQHHLNANLVTISACNGSGTRSYSGEGLVGLSWAFLRAGARKVIGALWEVSDVSTPQLMDSLYGELSEGKDPATALRDAKLKMLHSPDTNSVFRKPFYWAPFQLYAGS